MGISSHGRTPMGWALTFVVSAIAGLAGCTTQPPRPLRHAPLPALPSPPFGSIWSEDRFPADDTRWLLSVVETYEDAMMAPDSAQDAASLAQLADEARQGVSNSLSYFATHGASLKGCAAELTARAEARTKKLDAAIEAKKADPELLRKARAWWQAFPSQIPAK